MFWGDIGGRGKDIWLESTSLLRIVLFQASDAPCSSILYGYSHLP